MRIAIKFVAISLLLISAQAQAQSYKCSGSDGKVTLQQTPCPLQTGGSAIQPAHNGAIPSLMELTVRCSKLSKETTDYNICAAQLSCVEAGNQGAAYSDCVAKLTEGRRRADAAAESSRQEAQAKVRSTATHRSEPVDCTNLYSYARAKGHSWMEAVAIAKDAEDRGACQRNK